MKQLVVLVGLPGSGKTSYQRQHADWVAVSRSCIRQTMFGCSYDAAFETTVDRIFFAALLEALESPADVVCVDEPNLTLEDRAALIELARLAGRGPVAHVMPAVTGDVAYDRMQRNLKRLAVERPHLRVRPFPRKAFDVLADSYAPPTAEEGFLVVELTAPAASRSASAVPERTKLERAPLPLFSS